MSGVLSFCESVTASGRSSWHLRWLDSAGPKFGGGVTTPSLCGNVRIGHGWDLEVPITAHHLALACVECVERLGAVVDGFDVWWVCTKAHCPAFYDNPKARDEHSATCHGQPEFPF